MSPWSPRLSDQTTAFGVESRGIGSRLRGVWGGLVAIALAIALVTGASWLLGTPRGATLDPADEATLARSSTPPEPIEELAGPLTSVGSDTLNNVMLDWTRAFVVLHPAVRPSVDSRGSATAPAALTTGAAMLGPMARLMKEEESQKFQSRLGFPPTAIRVAFDAVGVYVHRDNPLSGLTVEKLRAMFAQRAKSPVRWWKDLGLASGWASTPVSLYGRNDGSPAFGLMKGRVLLGDDFRLDVADQPGSAAVVHEVAGHPGAIGYAGIGYETRGVRVVPLSDGSLPLAEPSDENIRSGRYPLSRPLFIYFRKEPNHGASTVVRAFLEFTLSKPGRELAMSQGLTPVSDSIAAEELAKLR